MHIYSFKPSPYPDYPAMVSNCIVDGLRICSIGKRLAYISTKSSDSEVFRVSARVCIASILGFSLSVSILEMYVRAKPHL